MAKRKNDSPEKAAMREMMQAYDRSSDEEKYLQLERALLS